MELFGRTVSFILRVTVTDQGHRGTCQEVGGEMTCPKAPSADMDAAGICPLNGMMLLEQVILACTLLTRGGLLPSL